MGKRPGQETGLFLVCTVERGVLNLKKKQFEYIPSRFMLEDSYYDEELADFAVMFIESLCHTKGTWAGKPFKLLDWQRQIIQDLFGIVKPNGYRQFNTAYIEIPKKNGKSELAAAVALLLCCGDGEQRAEIYGCAADRGQATIVFDVAADMVRMCPALNRRCKILASQKRIIYTPTNSFYQVLSAEAYSKHGFNIHGVVFDELHTQPNRKLFDVKTRYESEIETLSKDCSELKEINNTLSKSIEASLTDKAFFMESYLSEIKLDNGVNALEDCNIKYNEWKNGTNAGASTIDGIPTTDDFEIE